MLFCFERKKTTIVDELKMIRKLLYLTFIEIADLPTSGSSVRPQKMKEAFESFNIELKAFGGINNRIAVRKKTVRDVKLLLKSWKPDACYIEPPSGPLFYYGDIKLIRQIHRMGIPMSVFYRDAYWKYPEYGAEHKLSIIERIKQLIIKWMQIYQWGVFKKNIDLIYFPSITMAKEFTCPHKDALPPGGFVADAQEKKELSNPLQFIFVGGASRNYGTFLTIDSFRKLNESAIKAKVTYICPENQWNSLNIDKDKYQTWLEVVHTAGDQNLKPFYEQADVALLVAPRTFYRDFAVPIKLFEYMSYLKPIVVTNCTETARVVEENGIGWVTNDNVDSIVEKLEDLCNHPEMILKVREQVKKARDNNLWSSRAKKVIYDLNRFVNYKA